MTQAPDAQERELPPLPESDWHPNVCERAFSVDDMIAYARAARAALPQAASEPTDGPYSREVIAGAVARGWCHEKNSAKVMDSDLAFAIVDEVMQLGINEPMQEPTDAPSV